MCVSVMERLKNVICLYSIGIGMPVEWVAQTDSLVCANCGKSVSEGEIVVGDIDQIYHKEKDDCQKEK
jgi:hypothetical protein